MSSAQYAIKDIEFQNHQPIFESFADELMLFLAQKSPLEISQLMSISGSLAIKVHKLSYDFPNKSMGYKSYEGFTGEVFKSLDFSTLESEDLKFAQSNIKIISSTYGLLSLTDVIKPYRTEFNKYIIGGKETPIRFYKQKNTIALVNFLKKNGVKEIINLLPSDADATLDWKIIRAYAKMHKIIFKTISSKGELKTPATGRLKELRGLMAREIIKNRILTYNTLIQTTSPNFLFSPLDSKAGLPVFIVEE